MAITEKNKDNYKNNYDIELIEEEQSSEQSSEQAEIKDGKDPKTGQWMPGFSGNPGGRPKKGETIVDHFRDNPKGIDVINNVIEVASTFGSKEQHKDAISAVKLVIERLVPALKSSDININMDDEKGFVFMPTQTDAKKGEQ